MRRLLTAACPLFLAAMLAAVSIHAQSGNSAAFVRIKETSRLVLGYSMDARPFSYRNESGFPAGYSVELCQQIAEAIKTELHEPNLNIAWMPIATFDRFDAVKQGRIDIMCGADTITLARRRDVAFSIPIFPGGVGALLRSDAPPRLKNVLAGKPQPFHPTWRANAAETLQFKAFASVSDTTAEKWLHQKINDLQVVTTETTVPSHEAGVEAVVARKADALFGERAVLLDFARRRGARDVIVLDRLFTYEPLALTVGAGDEPFRLLVDRTLARIYAYTPFGGFYTKWFGEPDDSTITFFRWNAIPE